MEGLVGGERFYATLRSSTPPEGRGRRRSTFVPLPCGLRAGGELPPFFLHWCGRRKSLFLSFLFSFGLTSVQKVFLEPLPHHLFPPHHTSSFPPPKVGRRREKRKEGRWMGAMGLACRTFAPLTAAGSPLLLPSFAHTRTRSLVFARRSHGKKIFSSAGGKGRKRPSPRLLLGEREEEEETAVVKRKEGGRERWRQQKPPHSPPRPLASAPFRGWQAADKVAAAEEGGGARKKELSLSLPADNKRRRSPLPPCSLRNAENK